MRVHGRGTASRMDDGPQAGQWRLYTILYLDDGELAMLDRPGLTLIAEGFPLLPSDDDVKTDLEVTCAVCGEVVCDAEAGDELDTLTRVALAHRCLRTPAGKVITRDELDVVAASNEGDGPEGGYDLVPCEEHLDFHRGCAGCRIVPATGEGML